MDIVDVVVVDMHSTDGSPEMVRADFSQARLIGDTPNRGYGAAANLGARDVRGEWLLILNSDVELTDPRSVGELLRVSAADPTVAVVGAQLVGGEGRPQRSAFRLPGPWALAALFCAPLRYLPRVNARALGYVDACELAGPTDIGWVLGAVLLVSHDVFRSLGGFDERFFMNSEEVDLCARVRASGRRVVFHPGVTVVHHGGSSMPSGDQQLRWLAEGSALYTGKHFGLARLRAARVLATVAFASSLPVWAGRVLGKRWTWRDASGECRRYGRALLGALRV